MGDTVTCLDALAVCILFCLTFIINAIREARMFVRRLGEKSVFVDRPIYD